MVQEALGRCQGVGTICILEIIDYFLQGKRF